MNQRRGQLRAADVDRAFVADLLKSAVDEGRLSLSEYDERLRDTYAARTYGELDKIVVDLPRPSRAVTPAAVGAPAVSSVASGFDATADKHQGWVIRLWWAWFLVVGINVAIWLTIMVTTGSWIYPWPVWVAGPWGVVLIAKTVLWAGSGRRSR